MKFNSIQCTSPNRKSEEKQAIKSLPQEQTKQEQEQEHPSINRKKGGENEIQFNSMHIT